MVDFFDMLNVSVVSGDTAVVDLGFSDRPSRVIYDGAENSKL